MASQRQQLEVTMHVYSGRPNPTWTIDEDLDDPDLQFEGLKRQAKMQPERLGYRGFTVKRKETGIPPPVPTVLEAAAPTTAMAVDTHAGPPADLSIVDVPQLEQKLLNTSKEISSTLKNYVSSCLSMPFAARSAPVTLESAAPRTMEETDLPRPRELFAEVKHAPPFEPSKWNNSADEERPRRIAIMLLREEKITQPYRQFGAGEITGDYRLTLSVRHKWCQPETERENIRRTNITVHFRFMCPLVSSDFGMHGLLQAHQGYNNCYNYGNNMITDSFAQPGRAANQKYDRITGPEVKQAAEADGLKAEAVSGWNRVALVIWPDRDFHWYRLDSTGTWSHKPGSTPAIDTDNSGNKITDPNTCDRGPYTELTCYMWTHPDQVKIK